MHEILNRTMKRSFIYLLLVAGFACAHAVPMYDLGSPDYLPMQTQRIMTTGVAYSGAVYAPFDNTPPSEVGKNKAPKNGHQGNPRKGFIDGPNGPHGPSTVGEPFALALFAVLFAAGIAIKHTRKRRAGGEQEATRR